MRLVVSTDEGSTLGRKLLRGAGNILRVPIVAILLGVILPIVTFGLYGGGVAVIPSIYWIPEHLDELGDSWFSLSAHPLIIAQQLFVALSVSTLLSWLALRSRPRTHCAVLAVCTVSAVFIGILAFPMTLLWVLGSPEEWRLMFALIAPWLVAATYGSFAWDAHQASVVAAPEGGVPVFWGIVMLIVSLGAVAPFGLLALGFLV